RDFHVTGVQTCALPICAAPTHRDGARRSSSPRCAGCAPSWRGWERAYGRLTGPPVRRVARWWSAALAPGAAQAWDSPMDTLPVDLRLSITVDASACDLDDLAPCGGVDVKVGGDVDWREFVERAVSSS